MVELVETEEMGEQLEVVVLELMVVVLTEVLVVLVPVLLLEVFLAEMQPL
jgi:hypothetical protein